MESLLVNAIEAHTAFAIFAHFGKSTYLNYSVFNYHFGYFQLIKRFCKQTDIEINKLALSLMDLVLKS